MLGVHTRGVGRKVKVSKVVVHEFYNKCFRQSYDLALLKLSKAAQMAHKVGLVCLPTYVVPHGRNCEVTGWGRLGSGGQKSPVLREVIVTRVGSWICNDFRHYAGRIHFTMLCAGSTHGGKDACKVSAPLFTV